MTDAIQHGEMRLWGAYMVGYQHGIEAMKNAMPGGYAGERKYGVTELVRELERQERDQ